VSYNLGNEYGIIVRRARIGPFGMEAGLNEGLLPSSLKRCRGQGL